MDIKSFMLAENGRVPNNHRLPVLIYHGALEGDGTKVAKRFEAMYAAHGWTSEWRDGVFDYHHYHSAAHEALGVFRERRRWSWADLTAMHDRLIPTASFPSMTRATIHSHAYTVRMAGLNQLGRPIFQVVGPLRKGKDGTFAASCPTKRHERAWGHYRSRQDPVLGESGMGTDV